MSDATLDSSMTFRELLKLLRRHAWLTQAELGLTVVCSNGERGASS